MVVRVDELVRQRVVHLPSGVCVCARVCQGPAGEGRSVVVLHASMNRRQCRAGVRDPTCLSPTHLRLAGKVVVADDHAVRRPKPTPNLRVAVLHLHEAGVHGTARLL